MMYALYACGMPKGTWADSDVMLNSEKIEPSPQQLYACLKALVSQSMSQ